MMEYIMFLCELFDKDGRHVLGSIGKAFVQWMTDWFGGKVKLIIEYPYES